MMTFYRFRILCHAPSGKEFDLNYFAATRKDANKLLSKKAKVHERVTLLGSPDTAGGDWRLLVERRNGRSVRQTA